MRRAVGQLLLGTALPAGLATLAFAVGILTSAQLPVFLIAAAALAVILWRSGSLVTGPAQVAPRLVLALAVVGEYAAGVPMPDWPLLLAGVALVGLLLQERLVFRAARPLYRAANLPTYSDRASRIFDRSTSSIANTALIAVFIVAALLRGPTWLLALAAAVALAINGGTLLYAARRRMTGRAGVLAALRERVAEYEPKFMIYFTAPPGSNYQLRMWLPHLEQLDERFIVVLREPNAFLEMAQTTSAPVLYTPEMSTFDAVVVPSLKAVFYVNNGAKNGHCVRYGELTHIFLNHGDSDKVSSFNPVTAMYDRVFVAGQAGIDRYHHHGVDIPHAKFRIVGRPQVAAVAPAVQPIHEVTEPVVLYAPTWTGHYVDANYSSLPIGAKLVAALLARGVTVILRHHPYTTRNRVAARQLEAACQLLAADAERTGRAHRWGEAATTELSLIDCFNRSHALISDVSSVASEYLYSEKPFAITDMAGQGEQFVETFPLARVGYVIDRAGENLADVLEQLIKTDPGQPARLEAKVHYLGDFPPHEYAEAFRTEARRYL